MGLHSDMKRHAVELANKHCGAGVAVWPTHTKKYDPATTATVTDYMGPYRGLPTERPYSVQFLTDHLIRHTTHGASVSIAVVDDKRNVTPLKATEQIRRVLASVSLDTKKGLEKAAKYPADVVFSTDEKICLRRMGESSPNVRRLLWSAMYALYKLDVSKSERAPQQQQQARFVFDFTADFCEAIGTVNGVTRGHGMPFHALGEADLALIFWAHFLFSGQMSGGNYIKTIVLHTADSDTLLLAAFYLDRMPAFSMLHWATQVKCPRDKSKAVKRSKSDASGSAESVEKEACADETQSASASSAAAATCASPTEPKSGDKRKSPTQAPADESDAPITIDLQACIAAMCKEYRVDAKPLGCAMVLCGHDCLDTALYAYFKGMPAILTAFFDAMHAAVFDGESIEPSLQLFRRFICYLWKVKAKPFSGTIDELRAHYTEEHAKKIKAQAALPAEKRLKNPVVLRFPTDAVIDECACRWIYICDMCEHAHLGRAPRRTLAEILHAERARALRSAHSFLNTGDVAIIPTAAPVSLRC